MRINKNLKILSTLLFSLVSFGCTQQPVYQQPITGQCNPTIQQCNNTQSTGGTIVQPRPAPTPPPLIPVGNVPRGNISGQLIDTSTQTGLPNVRVEIPGLKPEIFTITDVSGNFTLNNVPQGKQVVKVISEEFIYENGNSNIVVEVTAGNTITAPPIKVQSKNIQANAFEQAFDGFKFPKGITIDKKTDDLFVIDVIGAGGITSFDRAEIKRVNSEGGVISSFGSRFLSKDLFNIDLFRLLKRSTSLSVDDGGNVFVADTGSNSVKIYGPTGRYIGKYETEFGEVYDVAVMTTGDVVVSDPGTARVIIFNSSKNIVLDNVLANEASDGVRGITTDGADNIYIINVSARPGHVIQKYDKFGVRLPLNFGSLGSLQPGFFTTPTDLAIDNRNGDIYVVDSGNNRVQRFNQDGNFLSEFGQFGSENGFFNEPFGIAVGKDGSVYVSDTNNQKIQKFKPGR